MQEEDRYDWETWYETANGIMGHKFSERVENAQICKQG